MKSVKTILAVMMLLAATAVQAQSTDVGAEARNTILSYLKSKSYTAKIDPNENIVLFNVKRGGETYTMWVSTRGKGYPMLFTLNTRPVDFDNDDKSLTLDERLNVAQKVVDKLCKDTYTKVYLNNNQLFIEIQSLATSADEYCKLLTSYIEFMVKAIDGFDDTYKSYRTEYINDRKKRADAEAKNKPAATCVIVPTTPEKVPFDATLPSTECIGVDLCVVDAAGNTIVPYGSSIKKANCYFIQPKVKLANDAKKATHAISAKIYNPQGLIMLPSADAQYSIIEAVEVAKDKKGKEYILPRFGYANPVWAPGEYKIEIYDNDKLVYADTFHIL